MATGARWWWSLAAALLAALATLLLPPEQLTRLLSTLPVPTSGVSSSDGGAPSPSPTTASLALDRAALRAFTSGNSRAALRWGAYRPGLYLGLRSRSQPFFVGAGLLWGTQHEDVSQLRHECRQEDRLQKYGWLQHDGRRYGLQRVEDQFNRVQLRTHYVRLRDGSGSSVDGWAARVEPSHLEPRDERLRKKRVDSTKLSLFFYVELGCEDESLGHACRHILKNIIDVASEPASAACRTADDTPATCTQMTLESAGVESGDNDRETPATGDAPLRFSLDVQLKAKQTIRHSELRFSGLKDTNVLNVKDHLQRLAERAPGGDDAEIYLDNIIEEDSTLVVVQAIVDADTGAFEAGDVTLDVVFNELATTASSAQAIDVLISTEIEERSRAFERKFEATFQLAGKHIDAGGTTAFNKSHIEFAHAAFSNLIGGTGFFYGSSLVQHDPESPDVHESEAKPLFTAVPSRSFFPRGFVWDEGFHQIGISAFDEGISRDVIAHWMDLMEDDGYIAREQILGQSARRRVPAEFIVQHVEHANPPTLLLAIEKMVQQADQQPSSKHETDAFLRLIFPFLDRWYSWLLRTQRGPVNEDDVATLKWRGRKADDGKLIANTLASGLDDYPRASHPSANEMHVDLLAWMIKMSGVMSQLSTRLGLDAAKTLTFERNKARFLRGLDRFHWNEELQSFFDVGDHSHDGRIERRIVVRCRNDATGQTRDTTATQEQVRTRAVACPAPYSTYLFPLGDGVGGVKVQQVFIPGTTQLQHVKHIGYVSIFPLLLKVLPPDSPKLLALLMQIADPTHLWSPFGLRSMSTTDMFFERENAPGDNPYWRGAIWINANYLALDALHYYAQPSTGSPFREDVESVYQALRSNVIQTIFREYERTGYLWEQYSGDVYSETSYGRGQRCHPFSGWTALVVNIMAEKY